MKKSIRIISVVLAAACLFGLMAAVTAETINLNLNGDINSKGEDIINLWDAQEALYGTAVSEEDRQSYLDVINSKILGTFSELTPIDGTYYITSRLGLQNIPNDPDATYVLMNDIDLGGADWTPIRGFAGTFDGNGKTISNFTVTACVADYQDSETETKNRNIGFFGDSKIGSAITDLTLENFTVNASDTTAKYVGTLIGSNRGTITGCFVNGKLIDNREVTTGNTSNTIYRGLIAGRIVNNTDGSITLAEIPTSAYIDEPEANTVSVSAAMALDLYGEDDTQIPFVGYMPGTQATGLWRDTTYSSAWATQNEQDRRKTVTDYMRLMGTVRWTPSEDFVFVTSNALNSAAENNTSTLNSTFSNVYKADTVYTGLPYNQTIGSYERFMSQVKSTRDDGVLTIQPVADGYIDRDKTYGISGFIEYMGNNCSGAVIMAWSRVSHSRPNTNYPYNGFSGLEVPTMIPCSRTAGTLNGTDLDYTTYYGIYPVGWTTIETLTTKDIIDSMDATGTLTDEDYLAMAECYAQSRPGDALIQGSETLADGVYTYDGGGHVRMIAYDPVVIRDSANSGTIDLAKSYVITLEQGDGLYDDPISGVTGTYEGTDYLFTQKLTSWRIDRKYPFELLLKNTINGVKQSDASVTGSGPYYIPVTIKAFSCDLEAVDGIYIDSRHVDAVNLYQDGTPLPPGEGSVFSYYKPLCSTLTITDASGNPIYEETRYIGTGIYQDVVIGQDEAGNDITKSLNTKHRNNFTTLQMSYVHGGYAERAGDALTSGESYLYTYELLLSNGRRVTVNEMKNYTSPLTFTAE